MSESESDSGSPCGEKRYADYANAIRKNYKHPKLVDNDKNTDLHYFAAKGNTESVVHYLRKVSRIVNPENYLGWTPLMMACRKGHLDTSKTLLDYGANATLVNKYGMTCLHLSIASGNLNLVKLILEHLLTGGISRRVLERYFPIISMSILFKHEDILEYLVTRQFELNLQTSVIGISPLMFAQAMENDPAITILLKNKCDTKLKNYIGHTAMDIATIRQQMKFLHTNDFKILTNKLSPANRVASPSMENNSPQMSQSDIRQQNDIQQPSYQNSQQNILASILKIDQKVDNSGTLPQVHSHPCVVVSPAYPNNVNNSVALFSVPSCLLPSLRKSSNTASPSSLPPPPNVTPISPLPFGSAQIFFPPNFSPSQPPITLNAHAFQSTMVPPTVNDHLNARFNSSASMFFSPTVCNFLSPCM